MVRGKPKKANKKSKPNNKEGNAMVPLEPETPQAASQKNHSTDGAYKLKNKEEPRWSKVTRGWLIVILTAVLMVFTAHLYYVAVDQTQIAKESAHADLRAYIAVVNPRYGRFNEEPLVRISVVNFGKTPAQNVCVYQTFTCWIRDTLPEDPRMFKGNAFAFMVAPGETLSVPVRRAPQFWIDKPTHVPQVYGKVLYTDHRGENHETVFAYQWENISESFRRMRGYNYGD